MSQLPPIDLLTDRRGLICAFLLLPQQVPTALEWQAATTAFAQNQPIWLHFNQNDLRARNWIMGCDRIPQEAKDTLLNNAPRIQFKTITEGIILVLGDLYYDFDTDPDGLGVLSFYISPNCLISTRRRPLKSIDQLRQDLMHSTVSSTPIQLAIHFTQILENIFITVVDDCSDSVNEIEDLILKRNFPTQNSQLGRLRQLLARLTRHLRANRQALLHLTMSLPHWCSHEEAGLLRQNLEKLEALLQDLELAQERSRLLQEELGGQRDEAINRNLYVLSIVTIVFLPVTLITGIFGMNVGGLPWTESSMGFIGVNLGMILVLIITVLILRQKRFL